MNGDPMLLLTTWDMDGNACGYNGTTIDYPYVYFPAIEPQDVAATASAASSGNSASAASSALGALKYSVCVKECPGDTGPIDCHNI